MPFSKLRSSVKSMISLFMSDKFFKDQVKRGKGLKSNFGIFDTFWSEMQICYKEEETYMQQLDPGTILH